MSAKRRGGQHAAVAMALAAGALAGCPEPQQKFDDFVARTPTVSEDAGAGVGVGIEDISGTFLLAIATTLAPDLPLQFLATTMLTQSSKTNANGTATLTVSAQPLAATGRTPVGAPIVVSGIAVDAAGNFDIVFGTQHVAGAANPITPGMDITATLTLHGVIASADRFCGTVTGMVTMPIMVDLAGSTWGAIRVPAGTTGAALPAPDVTCPIGTASRDGGVAARDGGVVARDGGVTDAAAARDLR